MKKALIVVFYLFSFEALGQVQVNCSGTVDSSYFSSFLCTSEKAVSEELANNLEINEDEKPLIIKTPLVFNNPYGGIRPFQGIILHNKSGELFSVNQESESPTGLISVLANNYGLKADYIFGLSGRSEDNEYQISQTKFDVSKPSVAKVYRNSVQVKTIDIGASNKTITYTFTELTGPINGDRILLQIFDKDKINLNSVSPTFERLFDQSSKDAQDLYLLGDIFGSINVDVSGLNGKKGRSSDDVCIERVNSGFYGNTISDDQIRRYFNEQQSLFCSGTGEERVCHCTAGLLKKIAEFAPSSFCPVGYKYLEQYDDSSDVFLTAKRRKFKTKCLKSGIYRTCKYTGFIKSCEITTDTVNNMPKGSSYRSAFSMTLGELKKKSELIGPGIDNLTQSYEATFYLPSSLPGFITGSKQSAHEACKQIIDLGQLITPANDNVKFLWPNNSNISPNVLTQADWHFSEGEYIGEYQRIISTQGSCETAASTLGVAGYENLEVIDQQITPFYDALYVDKGEQCPMGYLTEGDDQDYPESGLIDYHKYSDEEISCSTESCPSGLLKRSFKTYYGTNLQREAGQSGSLGGRAFFFIYDAENILVNYKNGSNGEFISDNLPIAPTKKYCAQILDNALAKEALPYYAEERKVPVVNLLMVTFYPLKALEPISLPVSNFPDRRESEAVFQFKKMDSSTRDFIFKEIISKQDLSN